MRAAAEEKSPSQTGYSARLSARYRNFLVPLLTQGVIGGFNALLVAQSGSGDAGWWPVVWLATMFFGVFFSAALMIIAGHRKLPVAYGIALGTAAGLGLTTYGVLQAGLHASWGVAMPDWLLGAQARTLLGSPWAPLLPYGAGLALHGLAMLVFNRRWLPKSLG